MLCAVIATSIPSPVLSIYCAELYGALRTEMKIGENECKCRGNWGSRPEGKIDISLKSGDSPVSLSDTVLFCYEVLYLIKMGITGSCPFCLHCGCICFQHAIFLQCEELTVL